MSHPERVDLSAEIARVFRAEASRALATLIRLLGDFDVAEEALQDAFVAAIEQWGSEGVPRNPRAWIVSAGRHRAIDRLRRDARFAARIEEIAESAWEQPSARDDDSGVADDRLRLIFTCCHPALAREAQVALTLRTICGLTTDEIARAFLVAPATMAQRLARATGKLRDARIPYRVPPEGELEERLDSVLAVIYLVFTEGYAATHGDALVRHELCGEAIRLARLVCELMPDASEARGLLALMVLHHSRRDARLSEDGELVLLDEQDRSRWNRRDIGEGLAIVDAALNTPRVGPYAIQSAVAALHARASSASDTDWKQIASLYVLLLERAPSAVIELNHAVAVAMADGPAAGLLLIDAINARGELREYHLFHSARADLLRRVGKIEAARRAYHKALSLTTLEPERRFLKKRMESVSSGAQRVILSVAKDLSE